MIGIHAVAALVSVWASPSMAASPSEPPDHPNHRWATALALTGAYASFGLWSWFAWYQEQPKRETYRLGGDGWFAPTTYAGGADKLGHAWSTLALSRLGAELLESGGWSRSGATLFATSACYAAFALIELNDGRYTELSFADLGADTLGVLGAVAFRHVPGLDEAVDVRVAWFPSPAFRRSPGPNFAEDYAGQDYLLALKPRALSAVRDAHGVLLALGFVNPVLGFRFRKEAALAEGTEVHRQTLFLGVTFDLQALIDVALSAPVSRAGRAVQGASHRLFEYVQPPYTTLGVGALQRSGVFIEQTP